MNRIDSRRLDELRPVTITTNFTKYAAGSVLIETGDTKVICTASVEDRVPPHVRGTGAGWVTAEYSMLPGATKERNQRDIAKLKKAPRSSEIQRLIGRSLRAAVDMERLGEISIVVDCDVIQADGGTRTASITGGFVALVLALKKLYDEGRISSLPLRHFVAATSVGIVGGEPLLDLCYAEDSGADVDMNVIMDDSQNFIEIQGTGERSGFTRGQLDELLGLAQSGIEQLLAEQRRAIGDLSRYKPRESAIRKIVVATGNMGKLKEIRDMLAPLQIEVLSMADAGIHAEIEETGTTFEENAMLKAKGVMELSGLPAIADDSGLAVEALDGAPGIYSARYGGEGASDLDRIQKLLHNMEGKDDRRAKFVSALAFAAPDGREFVVRGECHGVLLHEPRGELGFGYDPIFYDETYRQTFGEMDPELKNSISHRANAMKLFFEEMKKIHATGEQNVNQ